MAWPFIQDGIPILYYGWCRRVLDVCSADGAIIMQARSKDTPVETIQPIVKRMLASCMTCLSSIMLICRRLWLSGYVEDKPLVKLVRTLNAARKAAIAANGAFLTTAVGVSPLPYPLLYLHSCHAIYIPVDVPFRLELHRRRLQAADARSPHERREQFDALLERFVVKLLCRRATDQRAHMRYVDCR